MKTIKIIDLLNKIAKGEIPKTIVYDERYFTYDEKRQNYFSYDDSEIDWKYTVMEYINDEIEIIEEPQEHKIKKIKPLTTWYGVKPVNFEQPNTFKDNAKYIDYNTEMFFNKINEIIDYLEETK